MTVMRMMANTLGSSNNHHLITPSSPSFAHHHNATAILKGKKPYKSWLKDGVNGGPSSMQVLVSWLSSHSNYRKWKREDYSIDRVPKKELLEEIIDKLRQVGIYHRLSKDVASKISTLQSNYRMARKWHETEGRKLRQCKKMIDEELLKRFSYWNELHPVFSGRSGGKHHISYHRSHLLLPSPNIKSSSGDKPAAVIKQRYVFSNKHHYHPSQTKSSLQQPSKRDTLSQYQKNEEILMQQSNTMLNKLRQNHTQHINQERVLVNQAKLEANLYYEQCLSQAGFTDTEIKSLLIL